VCVYVCVCVCVYELCRGVCVPWAARHTFWKSLCPIVLALQNHQVRTFANVPYAKVSHHRITSSDHQVLTFANVPYAKMLAWRQGWWKPYICTCIYVYMYICICIYVYMYTHIYVKISADL